MSIIETMSEEQIEAAFAAAGSSLQASIEYHRELAADYRQRAYECESNARRWEQAIEAGRWWELQGPLEDREIEILCEVEPVPRRALLTEY